jgi:flagellar motor protein MotB
VAQENEAAAAESVAEGAAIRKFNDALRPLATPDADVILRAGRPVWRVPDSLLFAYGEADLKPEGKALLTQAANALGNDFELRIDLFTDAPESAGTDESVPPQEVSLTPKPDGKTGKPPLTPPPDRTPWDLTGARAAAIVKFFHEQASFPFPNVIAVPRADSDPVVASGKEGHARNRRAEITLAPVPAPFHVPETDATTTGSTSSDDAAPKPAHAGSKPAKKKTDKAAKAALKPPQP